MKFPILVTCFSLCLSLTLIACKPSAKDRMVEGQWFGVSWTIDGQPSGYDAARVAFQFNPDGTYQYAYRDLEESGTYFVTGQELYTTPDGQTKIMVKIKSVSSDTLKFEMNRGGQLELLTLSRN